MAVAAQAIALAKATGPECGICLDAFHINMEEADPFEAIRSATLRAAELLDWTGNAHAAQVPQLEDEIEAFVDRYNSDLANNLGNLVSRIATMADKYCGGRLPVPPAPAGRLAEAAASAVASYRAAMDAFAAVLKGKGLFFVDSVTAAGSGTTG